MKKDKEIEKNEVVPDVEDMSMDEKDSSGEIIDKESLKQALKEIEDEKRLGYALQGKTKEDLEGIIKLAQKYIKENKFDSCGKIPYNGCC